MSPNPKAPVAAVGSPSSNYEVTLDLTDAAREVPLVGSLLALENPMGEGSELAIGTVTQVTTTNRWHEDPTFRGVIRSSGEIEGMSGDSGDIRKATIRVQAAWSRPNCDTQWKASGPNLRMSPATGTAVHVVDNRLISDLTATADDLHYLGMIAGTQDVRLPLSIPDFKNKGQGAFHFGVYGQTGAGKSALAAYLMAGQMRHEGLGVVIVDPQGQWAAESGLPFSLQGFAAELGREVWVRRISTDLRLQKDSALFISMLQHTQLPKELGMKSQDTAEVLWYEVDKILRRFEDWDSADSARLLHHMLTTLTDESVSGRIYTTPDRRTLFLDRIQTLLMDPTAFQNALRQFAPIHNLFSTTNPDGGKRHSLWATLISVFERRPGQPAPMLILDMSSQSIPGMDEEVNAAAEAAKEILELDVIKAAILRNLFSTLKRASEEKFRIGETLNTLVVLDEAWRYAAPPAKVDEDEIALLSKDLAGYARDTRKFGIGWLYISQSTRSVNSDIWDQMSVRIFGYGLAGADLDKMVESVDDKDNLKLYRGFAPPMSSKKYPFLLTGPVSPLAVTRTPVTLDVYTNFDHFRLDNQHWIAPVRRRLGQEILTGNPKPVSGNSAAPRTAKKADANTRKKIVETNAAASENRKTLGVKDSSFADPFGNIEAE